MIYTKYKKWTNASKTLIKGQKYDSKFEAGYSLVLDQQVKEGELTHYDRQVKIELAVNNYHICNYYIDFIAYHTDGTVEYIEVKGIQMEVWKIKWKIFEALYGDLPNVKITLIQQGNFKPPKLTKIS